MAATTKTLTPTNQTISIPAFTDKPDNRLQTDSTGKLADAVNALSEQIMNLGGGKIYGQSTNTVTIPVPTSGYYTGYILITPYNSQGMQAAGFYMIHNVNGNIHVSKISDEFASVTGFTVSDGVLTLTTAESTYYFTSWLIVPITVS